MLTPIDIQNHVLKTTMGGYNKKETDDFIESVQASYEELYKENHDLKEKITTLSEGLQYYKQMEGTLQKALVLAEKTSTETLEAAQAQAEAIEQESLEKAETLLAESKEKAGNVLRESQEKAETILSDAQERAVSVLTESKNSSDTLLSETKIVTDNMLVEANRQLDEISVTVKRLINSYDSYKEQFKAIVSKQLILLNSDDFQIYVPDLDELLQSEKLTIAENQFTVQEKIEDMVSDTDTLGATEDSLAASVEATGINGMASSMTGTEDFAFGVSGEVEETETNQESEEQGELFSAESASTAGGTDTSEGNPFTFIDAN